MKDQDLRGNVVVLTGASTGIGRALALELASHGATLVLASRDEGALERVADECRLRAPSARVIVQATDVADEAQCRRLVERSISELGRIDTLVHNAGISMWAHFEDVRDVGFYERLMRVNYLGPVYLTHAALPYLRASRGRLVAISSVAGLTGVPSRTGYAASKHALVGFFDSLRIELMGSGVSVTIVYPDFVESEIRERAFGPEGVPLGRGNSPVQEKRVMTAEECARRTVRALAGRRRNLLLSRRSRVGRWLKLMAPAVVDRIARRAISRGR